MIIFFRLRTKHLSSQWKRHIFCNTYICRWAALECYSCNQGCNLLLLTTFKSQVSNSSCAVTQTIPIMFSKQYTMRKVKVKITTHEGDTSFPPIYDLSIKNIMSIDTTSGLSNQDLIYSFSLPPLPPSSLIRFNSSVHPRDYIIYPQHFFWSQLFSPVFFQSFSNIHFNQLSTYPVYFWSALLCPRLSSVYH